jgi:DNA-binding response OmpR family regulator
MEAEAQTLRILVIDDEVALAELMRRFLQRHGWEVVVASSGTEGCSLAAAEEFDVIIADLLLPGLSGQELLERLWTISQARILVCSGLVFDPLSLPEWGRRRCAFLQKPFSPAMLVEAVKSLRHGSAATGGSVGSAC